MLIGKSNILQKVLCSYIWFLLNFGNVRVEVFCWCAIKISFNFSVINVNKHDANQRNSYLCLS